MAFDREIQRRRFEDLGEAQVRDTAMQWSGEMRSFAYEWLRERDLEREDQRRANEETQIKTAQTATKASVAAAWAAVISVPIAIAALVVAILAWLHPRV